MRVSSRWRFRPSDAASVATRIFSELFSDTGLDILTCSAAAAVTLEQEGVALTAIDADQQFRKSLRKMSGEPEHRVEILAEQDTSAVRPTLAS